MRPIWALLSLLSLIAIVVVLWNSPETRDRISSVILGQPVVASQPSAQPAEKPAEKAGKKHAKPVRRYTTAGVAQPIEPVIVPPKPNETPRIIETGPILANVRTETAAVYSFNSPRSPVVKVLKKGEKVETNLEVIDSGGRWSLIHNDQLKSGFVRSENLEKGQMAASRN